MQNSEQMPQSEEQEMVRTVANGFVYFFNHMAQGVHQNSRNKGFWDQEGEVAEVVNKLKGAIREREKAIPGDNALVRDYMKRAIDVLERYALKRSDSEQIALMHSELSEMLEAQRHSTPANPFMSDHIPAFTGVEEEAADCIIRIMDNAKGRGWRVAEALIAKIAFNASREHMHGKQF